METRSSSSTESSTATRPPKVWKTPLGTFVLGHTLPTVYSTLVPRYESHRYDNLVVEIGNWNPEFAAKVREISQKRAANRIRNYIVPEEMERVRGRLRDTDECSIRFGKEKEGRGYHGKRGDFCLIGGAIERKNLTLFYRSLELIGGLAYDLCIIDYVSLELGINWKTVTIHAARAHSFALKGNSNEKLYPKFRRILGL